MIKVLVVDDEKLSLQNVTFLLHKHEDVDKVFEAFNGNQALDLFERHKPDIAFLDIEMPGASGLEIAKKIGHQCVIVFVTAYDQYAISAFEYNAIDYLLKPYEDERFHQAFERAKKRVREGGNVINYQNLSELFDHIMSERELRFKSRLVIKDSGRVRFADVSDINYITGSGNYAELHLNNGDALLHRESMTALENQLDPKVFVRIHRSTIVRVSYINVVLTNERGDYRVSLKDGVVLTVSRGNKYRLQHLLNN